MTARAGVARASVVVRRTTVPVAGPLVGGLLVALVAGCGGVPTVDRAEVATTSTGVARTAPAETPDPSTSTGASAGVSEPAAVSETAATPVPESAPTSATSVVVPQAVAPATTTRATRSAGVAGSPTPAAAGSPTSAAAGRGTATVSPTSPAPTTAPAAPRSSTGAQAAPSSVTASSPAADASAAYESRMLQLLNAERASAGAGPLVAAGCPDGFAEPWSPTMAANGGLSHQSMSPILQRCGARTAAENVGMTSEPSPEAMVARFMASPPHRANILDPALTGVGIAAYRDGRGVWWVTQDFVA